MRCYIKNSLNQFIGTGGSIGVRFQNEAIQFPNKEVAKIYLKALFPEYTAIWVRPKARSNDVQTTDGLFFIEHLDVNQYSI